MLFLLYHPGHEMPKLIILWQRRCNYMTITPQLVAGEEADLVLVGVFGANKMVFCRFFFFFPPYRWGVRAGKGEDWQNTGGFSLFHMA